MSKYSIISSQNAIALTEKFIERKELVENFHWFNSLKHSSTTPKAFTERELDRLTTKGA